MSELTEQHIRTLKDAASKLTGTKRRTFQAQVAIDYKHLCTSKVAKQIVAVGRKPSGFAGPDGSRRSAIMFDHLCIGASTSSGDSSRVKPSGKKQRMRSCI